MQCSSGQVCKKNYILAFLIEIYIDFHWFRKLHSPHLYSWRNCGKICKYLKIRILNRNLHRFSLTQTDGHFGIFWVSEILCKFLLEILIFWSLHSFPLLHFVWMNVVTLAFSEIVKIYVNFYVKYQFIETYIYFHYFILSYLLFMFSTWFWNSGNICNGLNYI